MSKLLDMGRSYKDVAALSRGRAKAHKSKKDKRKEEEKKYEKRRGAKNKDPKNFKEFADSYNLRAEGAGSDKKPKASRFSAKDVTLMFQGGKKRFGLSNAEAAKKVLAYADDMKGKTRMGGGTEKALDRLRGMLKEDKPKDEKPKNTDRPKEVKEDQERFEETRLDKPENQMPRLEDAYTPTESAYESGFNKATDANMAAIRGGDDLNEWYQTKFVPHLEADAMATASEIGDDSRYFLSKFAFEPPELGDIKELFDKYKGEIEDLD